MVQRRGVECWYWEQSDPSAGLGDGAGDVGLCLSALHPKVLCELLDFEKVFGVNCGAGGGQRAQHVRLQSRDTDTHSSLLLFHYCYTAYLNTVRSFQSNRSFLYAEKLSNISFIPSLHTA